MEFSKYAEVNPKCGRVPESFYYIDLECVNAGEIKDLRIEIANTAPSRAQRLLMLYDILFQTVRPYQRNNYHFKVENDLPTVASTGYAVFRTEQCSEYLYELIHTERFLSDIMKRCTGTSFPAVSSSDIEDITVWIPDIQEQKKIGDLLTLVDDKIAKQRLLIEHLKKYKRGVTNAIFCGKVCFANNDDSFPDWSQKKVGEICKIQTGKSNTQDETEDGIFDFYVRSPIVRKSNRYLFDCEAVLTVGDGVGTGKVFHYVNGKFDLHQRVYAMTDFTEVSGKYFYFFFSHFFYDRVMRMTAKTSVDSVRYEMIDQMNIMVPCAEEQDRIVDTLSFLEQILDKAEKTLTSMETMKKGLLQQLFI